MGALAGGAGCFRRRQQLELQSRAAALREAEERLASHAKRLLQLEQARDEALASQAAAAQRAANAEQRAGGAEQRAASAEQRLTELEQRAAKLSADLAQRQVLATQNAAHLDESARALTAAEQRAAATPARVHHWRSPGLAPERAPRSRPQLAARRR